MSNVNTPLTVQSEVGRLEAVLLHYPGAEVENMTPGNAQRALYNDILNLSIAQKEYDQLLGVLHKTSNVFKVSDLLTQLLEQAELRTDLIRKICEMEQATGYEEELLSLPAAVLSRVLIEGLPLRVETLTDFLREEYYALPPLYNFYFTRDPSAVIGHHSLVCKMANKVRARESFIMEAIFKSGILGAIPVISIPELTRDQPNVMIEGGDILVADEHILLIGNGSRTSTEGIDFLVKQYCRLGPGRKHVIVQQLPHSPESFIHLDMVFTMLDRDKAMVYKPLIKNNSPYQTVHIEIEDGKVVKISSVSSILSALRTLGVDVKPIVCGGKADEWDQEREQWHSGANFLAVAPGQVLSYARNIHTLEELDKNGFEVITAKEVIEGKRELSSMGNCVITINGSELPRGGGGPRCMTMPLRRASLQ